MTFEELRRDYEYEHYFDGKEYKRVYCCGGTQQDQMIAKGYRLRLAEFRETPQEIYDRLSKSYKTVKVVYAGTCVRGIRSYFAMCK